MKKMYGWAGKILRTDLSNEKIVKQSLDKKLKTMFIGGRGINVKILYDEVKPEIDAFDPENRLIFGSGPLVGALAPGASRFNVTAKSPLTFLGDSNAGGFWSSELKFAGYDHIVVSGRARKPIYLWICDDDVELRDATRIWGMDTWETQWAIRKELKDEAVQIACIGQAGENLVRFAQVKTGPKRSAGRTGMGAVMGSKNLKAIAVRGHKGVKVADPPRLMDVYEKAIEKLKWRILLNQESKAPGTYGNLWFRHNDACMLVTKHHQFGYWDKAKILDPIKFHEKYVTKMHACSSCPVHCTPYFVISEGTHKGLYGGGPEFESVASFGSAPGVSDLISVLKASVDADRFGLDCDSCGRVISYATELFQRGIISEKDVGFSLNWGDNEAVIKLIEMIARRKGFGDVLAEGEYRAGKMIGREAEKYVLHIKRLEQHESCRALVGHALGSATSTRGSDHLRSQFHAERDSSVEEVTQFFGSPAAADQLSYEAKAAGVIRYEKFAALADMLEICKMFSLWASLRALDADILAELLQAVTGIKISGSELDKAAERVYNVERAFIVREGVRRKDDFPPWRDFDEPLPSGPYKGAVLDRKKYNKMLDEYYELHGWTREGIPSREKLEELGLNDVADDLETQGLL